MEYRYCIIVRYIYLTIYCMHYREVYPSCWHSWEYTPLMVAIILLDLFISNLRFGERVWNTGRNPGFYSLSGRHVLSYDFGKSCSRELSYLNHRITGAF